MTSHKNKISQKWHLKTYITGFLKCYLPVELTSTIRRKLENLFWKSDGHGSESYSKFKNSLLKITQLCPCLANNLWTFFCKACYFCKAPFFWVLHLFILDGVFVMCIFIRWHYFQMALKGAFSARWHFVLGMSDGGVFFNFFYSLLCT